MTRDERCSKPAVRIHCLAPPDCDDEGFRTRGPDPISVSWSEVIRVAYVYYIYAGAFEDRTYWGLQTAHPSISYWIEEVAGGAFDAQLRQKFGIGEVPALGFEGTGVLAYSPIVWPPADVGKPMYTSVKRHWWSTPMLAYASD